MLGIFGIAAKWLWQEKKVHLWKITFRRFPAKWTFLVQKLLNRRSDRKKTTTLEGHLCLEWEPCCPMLRATPAAKTSFNLKTRASGKASPAGKKFVTSKNHLQTVQNQASTEQFKQLWGPTVEKSKHQLVQVFDFTRCSGKKTIRRKMIGFFRPNCSPDCSQVKSEKIISLGTMEAEMKALSKKNLSVSQNQRKKDKHRR